MNYLIQCIILFNVLSYLLFSFYVINIFLLLVLTFFSVYWALDLP